MTTAGIVLCGGNSTRMGRPKAWLPAGTELMLPRVVRIVRAAVDSVVVVAAPDQDVPPLPDGVLLVRDGVSGRGPLGGFAAGLTALDGRCGAVYLSSCDVPLLAPAFVHRVVSLLREPAPLAAVPRVGDRLHPLAAAYRVEVLPVVRARLAVDRVRMRDLFDLVPTRFIEADELADTDPEFRSLGNLNTPEEYEAVLRELERTRSGETGRRA